MRQIHYALQFQGQAAPQDEHGSVLHASTRTLGTRITTRVGAEGVGAEYEPLDGEAARFESEVRFEPDGGFRESGTIAFGADNVLTFETVGSGTLGPSPVEGTSHGCVMWRITDGSGRFAGASGLVTSNFTVDADGHVADNQYGVLWLPD